MTKAYHKDQSLPIGLFDSGVGGLSVLQSLQQQLPGENYLYIADNFNAPYGPRPENFITQRVLSMAEFLAKKQVKAMLIACNTATAAAITQLRKDYPIPIIGLEPALKPAADYCTNKRLGVLATDATLKSEKYRILKQKVIGDRALIEKGSISLVEMVETGSYLNSKAQSLIDAELAVFKAARIDALVLGCTHFPFLAKAIEKSLGKNVRLFESGLPVARELARQINHCLNPQKARGTVQYYSTDATKSQNIFEHILKKPIILKPLDI